MGSFNWLFDLDGNGAVDGTDFALAMALTEDDEASEDEYEADDEDEAE